MEVPKFTVLSAGAQVKSTTTGNEEAKKRSPKVKIEGRTFNPEDVNTVQLPHGVQVHFAKDPEEDFSKVQDLEDVMKLELAKPNLIVGFTPNLFHFFEEKGTRAIKRYIKPSDLITVKKVYMDNKGDEPRRVARMYFKSLSDMTVIIAVLEDGDLQLANRLELCK